MILFFLLNVLTLSHVHGFLLNLAGPQSPKVFDPTCVDKIDSCWNMPQSNCLAPYEAWAQDNCANRCGYCNGPTTPAPPCVNKLPNCESYDKSTCSNPDYQSWAGENCRYYCRLCPQSELDRLDAITTTVRPEDCVDKVDCRQYGTNACSGQFKAWSQDNCPNYCGYCTGIPTPPPTCEDKIPNCKAYNPDTCTNPDYKLWVEDNCKKYCGLCPGSSGPATSAPPMPGAGSSGPATLAPPIPGAGSSGPATLAPPIPGRDIPILTYQPPTPPTPLPGKRSENDISKRQFHASHHHGGTPDCWDGSTNPSCLPNNVDSTDGNNSLAGSTFPGSEFEPNPTPDASWDKKSTAAKTKPTTTTEEPITTTTPEPTTEITDTTDQVPTSTTEEPDTTTQVPQTTTTDVPQTTTSDVPQTTTVDPPITVTDAITTTTAYLVTDTDQRLTTTTDIPSTSDPVQSETTTSQAPPPMTEAPTTVTAPFITDLSTTVTAPPTTEAPTTVTAPLTTEALAETTLAVETTTVDCADKIDNCIDYGKRICSDPLYVPWAKARCSAFCEFCIPVTLTPFKCENKLGNCGEYGGDICSAPTYYKWSRENCYDFCGFPPCGNNTETKPPNSVSEITATEVVSTKPTRKNGQDSCDDFDDSCYNLPDAKCFGIYESWARAHCPLRCGFCGDLPSCEDKTACSAFSSDICTNPDYEGWSRENCRKFCNRCERPTPPTTMLTQTPF
ncbi:hypothetical protein ACF0H5_009172 [Mactra antiquata]